MPTEDEVYRFIEQEFGQKKNKSPSEEEVYSFLEQKFGGRSTGEAESGPGFLMEGAHKLTTALEAGVKVGTQSYLKMAKGFLKRPISSSLMTISPPVGLALRAIGKEPGIAQGPLQFGIEAMEPSQQEQKAIEDTGIAGLVAYGVGRLIPELPQYMVASAAGKAAVNLGFEGLVKRYGQESVMKAFKKHLPTLVRTMGYDRAVGMMKEIPALQIGFGGLAVATTEGEPTRERAKATLHAVVTAPIYSLMGQAGQAIGGRVGRGIGGALGFGGAAAVSGAPPKDIAAQAILGAGMGIASPGEARKPVQKPAGPPSEAPKATELPEKKPLTKAPAEPILETGKPAETTTLDVSLAKPEHVLPERRFVERPSDEQWKLMSDDQKRAHVELVQDSLQEAEKIARTDPLTGAQNGRALEERIAADKKVGKTSQWASTDVDDFKVKQVAMGSRDAGGYSLIRTQFEILSEVFGPENVFRKREGGDEGAVRAENPEALQKGLELAREKASKAVIEWEDENGQIKRYEGGFGFTYGIADSLAKADAIRDKLKIERKSGVRPETGREPASVAQAPAAKGKIKDNLAEVAPAVEPAPKGMAGIQQEAHFAKEDMLARQWGAEKLPLLEDMAKMEEEAETVMEAAGGLGGVISKIDQMGKDAHILWGLWQSFLKRGKPKGPIRQQGRIEWRATPDEVAWFRGILPAFSSDEQMGRSVNRVFAFPFTVGKRYPESMPYFKRGLQYLADVEKRAWYFMGKLKDFAGLMDKKRVYEYMIRGLYNPGNYPQDAESLRSRGFRDAEIAAIRSHVDTMSTSLDYVKDHLIDKYTASERTELAALSSQEKADPNIVERIVKLTEHIDQTTGEIESVMEQMKRKNYLPAMRFGKYWLLTKDNKGGTWYSFHENFIDLARQARKFGKMGRNVRTGKVLKAPPVYEQIPLDLLVTVRDLWKLTKSSKAELFDVEVSKIIAERLGDGGAQHLLHAKAVPGFSGDILRNDKAYLMDMINWVEGSKTRRDLTRMLDDMIKPPPGSTKTDLLKEKAGLYMYWKNYGSYLLKPIKEFAGLRQFMFGYYLWANVKSALLQLTQTATMTYPELLKYSKNSKEAGQTIGRAINLTRKYIFAKMQGKIEQFEKEHKDIYDLLQMAHDEGELQAQMLRDIRAAKSGRAMGGAMEMASEIGGWMFQQGEQLNRYIALTARFLNVHKNQPHLSMMEAYELAKDFNHGTQGIYSKANRPEIARGPIGAPAFIFRMYTGLWLSQLKANAQLAFKGDKRAASAVSAQLAVITALGGATAIPLVKELTKAAEAAGFDPKRKIREIFGDWSDYILHGSGTLMGWDMSGAVGLGEIIPDIKLEPLNSLVRYASGTVGDLPQRVNRAMEFRKTGQYERMTEAIMPEMIRNAMVSARWWKEGVRGAKGELMIPKEKVTLRMTILKALGMQPSEVTKVYERENSEYILKKLSMRHGSDLNFKMARALFRNDNTKVDSIMKYITDWNRNHEDNPEQWIVLDDKAIRRYMANMMGISSAELREFPRKARPEYQKIQEAYE